MSRKKIILAHLPQWDIQQPPMGIAYIASYIRKYGYEVTIRDFSIELYSMLPEDKKYLLNNKFHTSWIHGDEYLTKIYPEIEFALNKWADELIQNDADIIGFTVLCTNYLPVFQLAKRVKGITPNKIIVIGGPHATRYGTAKEIISNDFVDFVVPGEGEAVFKDLLDAINGETNIREVTGLLYRNGTETIDTGNRPLIKNIDELPYPCFQDYPLDLYNSVIIPILGSRGCVYNCSFCCERTFWESYRFRTGENIFKEVNYHCDTIGPHHFYIVDSLINGNMRELDNFCDLVIKNSLKITWGGKAAIRKEMTQSLLNKMHKAGCIHIEYGMESASSKVLRDMNKRHDASLASEVIMNTCYAGIKTGTFWIIGFPTESEDDFKESMDFVRSHARYIDHITPGYGCGVPFGSTLYTNPEKYGIYWKNGEWFSEYTSPRIRAERVEVFRKLCYSLGLKVD